MGFVPGRRVLAAPVLGAPYLVVLVELLSLATYDALRAHLTRAAGSPARAPARAAAPA